MIEIKHADDSITVINEYSIHLSRDCALPAKPT